MTALHGGKDLPSGHRVPWIGSSGKGPWIGSPGLGPLTGIPWRCPLLESPGEGPLEGFASSWAGAANFAARTLLKLAPGREAGRVHSALTPWDERHLNQADYTWRKIWSPELRGRNRWARQGCFLACFESNFFLLGMKRGYR